MDQYKELLNELESCLKIAKKDLAEIDEERKENAENLTVTQEMLKKIEDNLQQLGIIKNTLLNYDNTINNIFEKKLIVITSYSIIIFSIALLLFLIKNGFYLDIKILLLFAKISLIMLLPCDTIALVYNIFKETSDIRSIKAKYTKEDIKERIRVNNLFYDKLQEKLASLEVEKEELETKFANAMEVIANLESQIAFNNLARENALNNPAIVEILNKAYQESPDKLVLARTISN